MHLMPFVIGADGAPFLKTIILGRKATWDYHEEALAVRKHLDAEEREILEKFERGELRRAADADHHVATAPETARNTFRKTRRVNLRVTEHVFNLAQERAREEGIPYQTLLSSVIHKYLSGRLTERR